MKKMIFLIILFITTNILYSQQNIIQLDFMNNSIVILDGIWNKTVSSIVDFVDGTF